MKKVLVVLAAFLFVNASNVAGQTKNPCKGCPTPRLNKAVKDIKDINQRLDALEGDNVFIKRVLIRHDSTIIVHEQRLDQHDQLLDEYGNRITDVEVRLTDVEQRQFDQLNNPQIPTVKAKPARSWHVGVNVGPFGVNFGGSRGGAQEGVVAPAVAEYYPGYYFNGFYYSQPGGRGYRCNGPRNNNPPVYRNQQQPPRPGYTPRQVYPTRQPPRGVTDGGGHIRPVQYAPNNQGNGGQVVRPGFYNPTQGSAGGRQTQIGNGGHHGHP